MNGLQGPRGNKQPGSPRQQADSEPQITWPDINFGDSINPELFNTIAKDAAGKVAAAANRKFNKPTQLRRFYDELCLWEQRVAMQPDSFQTCLPFIRMMNAKAAYAQGRELVERTYVSLLHHTLSQVSDAKRLTTCKLFWEAFTGFYKQLGPKDQDYKENKR